MYNEVCPPEIWKETLEYFRNTDARTAERIREKIDRYLQIIQIEGGTESIPNWRLKEFLLTKGFGAFAPHEGKLYFLLGNPGGVKDAMYLPTEFIFANPYLKWSDTLKIGEDCVFAKNDRQMTGILPIIRRYSFMQSHIELSMYIATVMSRLTTLGIAGRDAEAEAIDLVVADVEKGKIRSITDRNILQQIKTQPYGGQTGILTDLIEFMQYEKASEANDLGLQANWNAKRETLTSSETLLNTDTLLTFVDNMKECWDEWAQEVNEKYGEYLENGPYKITFGSSWEVNEEQVEATLEQLDNLKESVETPEENIPEEVKEDGNTDNTLSELD